MIFHRQNQKDPTDSKAKILPASQMQNTDIMLWLEDNVYYRKLFAITSVMDFRLICMTSLAKSRIYNVRIKAWKPEFSSLEIIKFGTMIWAVNPSLHIVGY